MTRPDDIAEAVALARSVLAGPQRNSHDVRLARALLRLEPVWEAAQEWERVMRLPPAKNRMTALFEDERVCQALLDATTTARQHERDGGG